MAITSELQLPNVVPNITALTLDSQKSGVITLVDKSKLPKTALEEAVNLYLYEDGNAGPRPGVDWYGTALPNSAEIDGFDYFDSNGTIHLVATGGGVVYRSLDNAVTWTACTGGTPTAGRPTFFNQAGAYLYITNDTDTPLRYDGTTTLQAYSGISAPVAPTVTASAGLSAGPTATYYYKTAAINAVGYTDASAATSVGVNRDYTQWDTGTYYNTITHAAVVGATRYDYYRSDNNLDFYYIGSSVGTSTTFKDSGLTAISSTIAPTTNTTTGERYEEYTSVGSRQFGIRHALNRYQIGYSSGDLGYEGSFSGNGGGSVSWQKGGKYIPVKVADYRDGKGTPLATIWCDSADGQGCIIQMSLDQVTIADQTFYLPNLYKLPGSRGTPAPGSVVNVLNDYYFYNSQAIYNLGNRPNLQQILSTDEMSANIRPTVKQTSTSAERNIASAYFDAKIFYSVPRGSTSNNVTMIYDTERRAWLPDAFTLGFKRFLRYTSTESDSSKTQRLLVVKPGDNRLSQISTSIQGDYGQPFSTSLKTGLYPTMPSRFGFQHTKTAFIELSQPAGSISVELLGIERKRGFSTTKSQTIQSALSTAGHSTFLHSSTLHSVSSGAVDTYSESSVKRYFKVEKELNAVQWHISTNTLNAFYLMRTLQTEGRVTNTGSPRDWQLK